MDKNVVGYGESSMKGHCREHCQSFLQFFTLQKRTSATMYSIKLLLEWTFHKISRHYDLSAAPNLKPLSSMPRRVLIWI